MSDDEYPRVVRTAGLGMWAEVVKGGESDPRRTHKVVPLDAIVIERSELPDVQAEGGGCAVYVAPKERTYYAGDADDLWIRGLRLLAAATYLREHPPVDEAQVEALAAVYREEEIERQRAGDTASWEDIARRLVARGVRVEVAQ
jgi:hypothetical protein